jgi:hypothetical protein
MAMQPPSRKSTGGDNPRYIRGHYRKPPEDVDWTRRYLRRRRIECEGDALQAALDSLHPAEWKRMKAAWRRRESASSGAFASGIGAALNELKRLGSVWCRLISWGVISEEDARLLAGGFPGEPYRFYDDAGAKFHLSCLLNGEVERRRREAGGDRERRLKGYVAAALKMAAEKAVDETLDSRVISFASDGLPEDEVREHLAAFKASGDYDRIIAEAR